MKKLSRNICLVLIGMLLIKMGSAQTNKINAGNKMFDKFLYNEAIYIYEGVKSKDAKVLRNLADSYRMVRDSKHAEYYYGQLNNTGSATPEDLWNYADALKMNGKYDEAFNIIEQYNKVKPDELRTKSHLADKGYVDKLNKLSDHFNIKSIKNNSGEADYGTTFYHGEVIFVSSRPTYSVTRYTENRTEKTYTNLYAATEERSGNDVKLVKFHKVKVKGGLNKRYHEGPVAFSPDGRTMIFTRNSYAKKSSLNEKGERVLELWMSKKGIHEEWLEPTPLPFNNIQYNVGHPAISPDGKYLYFASNMPGGLGGSDIWKVEMTFDGSFGTPVNMGRHINTEGNELYPFIHQDNIIFFASDGHAGLGGLDVFAAHMKNGEAGNVTNLGAPLNSNKDDFAFIIDNNMKKGYVSSNRDGGKGLDDIYAVEVLKPFNFTKTLLGVVTEDHSNSVLPGVIVQLLNDKGEVVEETTTDINGQYSFEAEGDKNFLIKTTKDTYTSVNKDVSTKTDQDEIVTDFNLHKKVAVYLACLLTDKKTGAPIEGAHIVIKDNRNQKVLYDAITNGDGRWNQDLDEFTIGTTLYYNVFLSKDGYIEKNQDLTYEIKKEGPINLHEVLDFTLGQLEVGADLGKLIGLKTIYFDVNKYNIRPDAAIELDKIVEVMKNHPHIKIELDSHTDCDGSTAANHTLSQKRADASVAYIISKGISADRITGKGFGEERPAVECNCEGSTNRCTTDQKALNRRTEFVVKQGD